MHWLKKLLCHFSVSACSGLTQLLTLFHNMSWYRQAFLKKAPRLTVIFISSAIRGKAEPIKQAKELVCVPFCSLMFQLTVGVLWKSGCFHFLMKTKCYIPYSNLLPLRFFFKIFLEGCCSSPLQREIHNTEIYMYWTTLDLPWKNRCRNSVWQMQMEKQSAWHNRKCLQLSRLQICLKEDGNGFQKGKSLHSVVACKSYISHPEGLSLSPVIQQISSSHCSFPWLICHMFFFSPSAPPLWGAVYLSHIPTNFKRAFPLSSCSGA